MKFALGGNHDENNTQTANELVAGILDESVYAEEVYLGDIFLVVAGPAVIAAAAARQAGGLSARAEQSSRKGLAGALTGEDHDHRLLRSLHNRVARATGKIGAQVYRLGVRER